MRSVELIEVPETSIEDYWCSSLRVCGPNRGLGAWTAVLPDSFNLF